MARSALLLAALTALSILASGYCVFCDGHALEIPLVKKIQDPSLFPDDPFAETLASYPSAVWRAVAVVSRHVDLEVVLGFGFVLTRILLLWSGLRLGRALAPQPRFAAWAGVALLALGPRALVGSGTTIEVFFEQSSFFMPFFLFALASLIERRPISFALAWGVGFAVNPMYGIWAGLIFLGTWVADSERGSWRSFARAAPIFLVITAPIVWQALVAAAGEPADHYTWMWVNRTVHSIHLFPETWPAILFYKFFAFLILLVAIAWAVKRERPRLAPIAIGWSLLGLLFLGLAYLSVATEWRLLITLHPARATDSLYLCGAVAIVVAGTTLANRVATRGGLLVFAVIFSFTVYLLVPFTSHATLVIACATAALATLLLPLTVRPPERRRRAALASAIVWLLGLALWVTASNITRRIGDNDDPSAAFYRRPPRDILRLSEWALESTPPDAVFFHDPISWNWAHFRYLAERPVLVTWKDASGVLWSPPYAQDWSDRFVAFGFNYRMRRDWDPRLPDTESNLRRTLRSRYRVMRDRNLRSMQKRYRIDYWIAPRRTESSYPVAFEADAFKILDVRAR